MSHMRKKTIQLWTDHSFSEFSLISESRTLVETKKEITYNMLIDELECIEGFDYDWGYMLSQWIPYYFSNKYLKKALVPMESKTQGVINNESKVFWFKGSVGMRQTRSKPQPGLKCHFCNLKYSLEEERKEHEAFWHGNQLAK